MLQDNNEKQNLVRLDPGSSVKQRILDGRLGKECGALTGSFEHLQTIGLECPLLEIRSPFTFVSKTPVVAFYIRLDLIIHEYDQMDPHIVTAF